MSRRQRNEHGDDGTLYLEDFAVGQTFGSGRLRVDADQVKAFAAEFDPQPFHLDERTAAGSFFGGLAASGWHTAALTMRLLVTGDLRPAGGIVGLGGELSWTRPLRPGDELHRRKRSARGAPLEIAPRARADQGPHDDAQPGRPAGADPCRQFDRAVSEGARRQRRALRAELLGSRSSQAPRLAAAFWRGCVRNPLAGQEPRRMLQEAVRRLEELRVGLGFALAGRPFRVRLAVEE